MLHRIEYKNIWYGDGQYPLFRGLDLKLDPGNGAVIKGDCGSGKTALMEIGAGLLTPEKGDVYVDGFPLSGAGPRKMIEIRKKTGFMFQNGALISNMTIFDNAALPLKYHLNLSQSEVKKRVKDIFSQLRIQKCQRLLPEKCNKGEIKRAALARALIMRPNLLLLDEPMEGLDDSNKEIITKVILDFFRFGDSAVMIATSSFDTAEKFEWPVFEMKDGGICGKR